MNYKPPMNDQAATLRDQVRIFSSAQSAARPSPAAKFRTTPGRANVTRVISFTGGKGGVGKTSAVVNVAVALARSGRSVLLLDADLGLANVDVMLGLTPRATIHDVLEGRAALADIILEGPEGLSIIPAASGVEAMTSLSTEQRLLLLQEVESIAAQFDYLLIDTQAGIGDVVLQLNSASSEIICVVNPEPTSLTDAYALIKIMAQSYGEKSMAVLVNNVSVDRASMSASDSMAKALDREAQATFSRLARVVERFLQVELRYLGFVPSDRAVSEAVRAQRAVVDISPSAPAALAFDQVARRLDADFFTYRVKGGMQFFFQQLLELDSYGQR